jgi:hypothetical protein
MDIVSHIPHDPDNPRQWMEFYLRDGRVLTSRQINWQMVPLARVDEVQFHLKGEHVGLRRRDCPSTFREFVVFRTAGIDLRWVTGPAPERQQMREYIPFQSWTLGWTDGLTEYLDEFHWKSGKHMRRYTVRRDFKTNPTHFHKDSQRILVVPAITLNGGAHGPR